ncbi:hypothetical protein WN72_03855 [Bradyrhizobium arachidis]|uniref:Uncharacterized protein n=1 Tax=Bradyrhizobium arachidis TaxID=858423 RepID=A0AAE7TFH9_9BRAD|nr:hypothetical protein WN72_03855 [Bradyrhizobium arachidis]
MIEDQGTGAANSAVVPANAGTHNPREQCGARWWLPVFAKPLPVVMGPGSALRFAALVRDEDREWSIACAQQIEI